MTYLTSNMAFILKDSPECVKSELELFHLPPTQTAIDSSQWVEFFPLSNVTDGGPVEFHISGSAEEFIDLSQTQLYVKAKIVKSDGTPLETTSKIGPVNLFLHSLFSQVDITVNDRLISDSNNTYPYRAYLETLINHGFDSKTSQLTAEMFYKDSEDGLAKRSKFFENSKTVDMIGNLHSDLFNQDRLLLNMVDLKVKLIRSKPEFCLMGDQGFKVILEHISLFVRKVRTSPGVILGHAKALEKTTAKYPIKRAQCKVYSVPKGYMSIVQDNIIVGEMPQKVIVACLDNDAFHGSFAKSPFEFNHHHLSFIGLYIDGKPVPHNPMELNFEQNQYVRAYNSLFTATQKTGQDQGNFMSREEYLLGNVIYAYDLSPDACNGEHLSLTKQSNLRLEMKFSKALESTINILVYTLFDGVIQITKNRSVLYDFGN